MKNVFLIVAMIGLLLMTPLGKHIADNFEVGIILLLLTIIATFLFWLITGCRKSFEEELLSERNQERNKSLAMVFILVITGLIIYINNR
jgi:Ca2+/Na+ antiporter